MKNWLDEWEDEVSEIETDMEYLDQDLKKEGTEDKEELTTIGAALQEAMED